MSSADFNTSKYSSYRKYVTSSEVSYDSNLRRSTYSSQVANEYSSSRGVSSSQKEIISATDTHSLPVYIATQDYQPDSVNGDALPLEEGQIVEVLDNKNASSWLVRTKARPPKIGWAPGTIFETPTEYYRLKRQTRELSPTDVQLTKTEEALLKRNAVFQELMKSEEAFVSELHHLLQTYLQFLDRQSPPPAVRQLKEQLSLNLREIYNFHANVLLKGFQFYSDDPGIVGQTFMRLERDFDHHIRYCHDEPETEKLLEEPVVKDYFQRAMSQIETSGKTLLDYLRLPINRIQEYQQYLKELIRYSLKANISVDSLQKALELMLCIPKRASDLNYIRNISELSSDTAKLGRLLRHEQLEVREGSLDSPGQTMYVFLFKSRIIFTQKIDSDDPDEMAEFKHKFSVRMDKYDIKEHPEDPNILQLVPVDNSLPTYFLKAVSGTNAQVIKQTWMKDVMESRETIANLVELESETAAEYPDFSDIKSEFSEYSSTSRKSSVYGDGDEGPPRKKPKTPPAISRSTSAQSLYSMNLESMTQTGSIEMEGSSLTRTQYGFRTFHETTAKMCLKVTGNPMPVITWYKDGVLLQEDDRHKFFSDEDGYFSMTIEPVLIEDTGRYTCVATNEYGQATTSAFFRVVKVEREPEEPIFLRPMEDLEVHEGDTATLHCEVEGWPEPEVQFFFEGQPIHPSREHQIEYDGRTIRLAVREVQPQDAGTYMIQASNPSGEKQCRAVLRVIENPDMRKVSPEFQQVLKDATVTEDESVKFKVVCSGDPDPEVSWYINGSQLTNSSKVHLIAEDGIYILAIDNITEHFQGELTCCAFNRIGQASCSCKVTITKPDHAPIFEQDLRNQEVCVNDSIKLRVVISSQPSALVTWWLNGKQLTEEDDNLRFTSKPQSGIYVLDILAATTEYSGEIECHASNDIGEASSKATVSVESAGAAPSFLKTLEDIQINKGQPVEFQLTVDGQPYPEVTWKLNDRIIQESDMVKISVKEGNIHCLRISSISEDLMGRLECIAENVIGKAVCGCHVSLNLGQPKGFDQTLPTYTTFEEGQQVTFVVHSSEPAEFSWLLNGSRLDERTDGVKIIEESAEESRIIIEDFSSQFSGILTCQAKSASGISETSTTISSKVCDVISKTTNGPLPPVVKAECGGKISLQLVVEVDKAEVEWILNGKKLENTETVRIGRDGQKFFLEISDADDSIAGRLQCNVRHHAGSDTFETEVVVERRTTKIILKGLEDTVVNAGDTVQFRLNVQNAKKFQVKWLLNGKELAESDSVQIATSSERGECSLKLTGIKESFNGKLECHIETPAGDYVSQAQLTVLPRSEPTVMKGLADSLVCPGETVQFKVFVENATECQVTWVLNGQELQPSDTVKISKEPDGNCCLKFVNISEKQSGVLECRISTPAGDFLSKAQLTVQAKDKIPTESKPEFRAVMAPVVIYEGDTLQTRVVLEGEPQPLVEWYLNDKKLEEDSNVKIITEKGISKVEIKQVNSDISGTLKCVARNRFGEVETSTSVSVHRQIPVEFEQYLCDTSCREGDTLKLKAVLLGQPAPDVSWYINGKKLVNGNNIHIYTERNTYVAVIKDITCDCSGEVLCKAVNEFGEATSSAMLTVLPRGEPPDFLEWMNSICAYEGAEVVHRVRFSGDPAPTIRWFINNQEIHDSENFVILTKGDVCTLTIKKFSASLIGEILCKAENDAGEVSCTAHMTLASGREEFSERSELEAVALSTGEIEGSETGTDFALSLPDEDMEEEASRLDSSMLAPKFISKIKDTRVTVGKQAVFECLVPGTKGVCVKWLKDNKEIELLARIRVGSHREENMLIHRLTIDDVRKEDIGTYTCVVMNEHGQEMCSAKLEVTEEFGKADIINPPQFTSCLSNVDVRAGAKAVLSCTVSGFPTPETRWFKDGEQIQSSTEFQAVVEEDGTHKLIISPAVLHHAGIYTCQAYNIAGKVETTATLQVHAEGHVEKQERTISVAPKFSSPLKTIEYAEENEMIEMVCRVTGKPEPEVHWFKGGAELRRSDHVEISTEEGGICRLILRTADVKDEGMYTCSAENLAGRAETRTELVIKRAEEKFVQQQPLERAPSFRTALVEQKVEEGETTTFVCSVTGLPEPVVKWFKEETEVKESERYEVITEESGAYKLIVHNVNPADEGLYRCIAENRLGKSETEARLIVHRVTPIEAKEVKMEEAPMFTTPMTTEYAKEGTTVHLTCQVLGYPQPEISWFKGDTILRQSDHCEVITEDSGVCTLIVHDVQQMDEGHYRCVAENRMGRSSTESKLIVQKAKEEDLLTGQELAPQFVEALQPQTADIGDVVTLSAKIIGQPSPEIRWQKDGVEVKQSDKLELISEIDGTVKLVLHGVTPFDQAEYTCEAVNKAGASMSMTHLTIREHEVSSVEAEETAGPSFATELHYQKVTEGESVVLCCKATGFPVAEVHWFKDSSQIMMGDEHFKILSKEDGTMELRIENAVVEDQAMYSCEVVNQFGKATTKGNLEVCAHEVGKVEEMKEVAPSFSSPLQQKIFAEEGEVVSLYCVAIGNPEPVVRWLKDGRRIEESERIEITQDSHGTHTLMIQSVITNDQAEYSCEAVNIVGSASTKCQLEVHAHYVAVVPSFKEEAPCFVTSLHQVTADEGEEVSLRCVATGQPEPDIHWFKDDRQVEETERIKIIKEEGGAHELHIQKVSREDQAEYSCEAVNTAGKVSTKGTLEVRVHKIEEIKVPGEAAPEFIVPLEQVTTAEEGEQMFLRCVVIGKPEPEAHWFKNGRRVDQDEWIEITKESGGIHVLRIEKVATLDEAEYSCEAINKAGKAVTTCSLKVHVHEVGEVPELEKEAPAFSTPLQKMTAIEGEKVTLHCVAVGQPEPEVHWLKDGQRVKLDEHVQVTREEGGIHELLIQKTVIDDQAEYTCEAINEYGRSETTCLLEVKKAAEAVSLESIEQSAPFFTKSLEGTTATCGETLIFECAVSGSPFPEITWYRGEEQLTTDQEHVCIESIGEVQRLQIKGVSHEDAGHYLCMAKNAAGVVKSSARLEIQESEVAEELLTAAAVPLEFSVPLHNISSMEGESVVLECSVSSQIAPDVIWMKGENRITADGEQVKVEQLKDVRRLILKSVEIEDAGLYRCIIETPKGVVSTEAVVQIKSHEVSEPKAPEEARPIFKQPLKHVTVSEGEMACLECVAEAPADSRVMWFRGNAKLTTDDHTVIESVNNVQRLVLKGVAAKDVGQYRCIIESSTGTVSTEGHLEVKKEEETTVSMAASAAPEFVEVLHMSAVDEHQVGTMRCKVAGTPKPQVAWSKDGVPLEAGEKYEMISEEDGIFLLKVLNATSEDSGEYRCEAFNEKGRAWSEAPMTVRVPESMEYESGEEIAPDFIEPVQARVVNKGEDVILQCRISGVPTPEVCWYKAGKSITPNEHVVIKMEGDRHKLLLYNAQDDDAAEYRCEARNDAGVVWSDATICVLSEDYLEEEIHEEIAPFFLRELHQESINEGEKISLSCQVSGYPLPDVHWYKDGQVMKSSEEVEISTTSEGFSTIIIKHAHLEDQGNYRCEAVNPAGTASSKAPVTVYPTEEIMETEIVQPVHFVEALHHYLVKEDTVAVFECKLEAPPSSKIVWYKDGSAVTADECTTIESLPDGVQRLTIKGVTADAAGHYTCMAKSIEAEVKTEDDLQISEKLEFSQGLKHQTVKNGDTVVMTCQVNMKDRTKLPVVKWYKSGKEILPDSRIHFDTLPDGTITMTINKIEESDAGTYSCVITAGSSTTQTEAALVVTVTETKRFTIVEDLENKTVKAGTELVLQIKASEPCDTVKWFRGTEQLVDGDYVRLEERQECVCRLLITRISMKDEGTYRVVARKRSQTAESQAKVTVIEEKGLTISQGLDDVSVAEGTELILELIISEPAENIQWYFGSKKLVDSQKVRVEELDGSILRLHIKKVDKDDAGQYSVVIKKGDLTVQSSANVSVQPPPKLAITQGLEDTTVMPGETIQLSAQIDGFPDKVEWFKDDAKLKSVAGVRIEISDDGFHSVTIENVTEKMVGLYKVKATNRDGSVESSATVGLKSPVEEKPGDEAAALSIIKGLEDKEVGHGDSLEMTIKLSKKPKTVKWYRSGIELRPSNKVKIIIDGSDASLNVADVNDNDSGEYSVVAEDDKSSITSRGMVKVTTEESLKIKEGLHSMEVVEGEPLILTVEIEGQPDTVEWLKDGVKLPEIPSQFISFEDGSYKLEVKSAQPGDAGRYKVIARIRSSSVSSEGSVSVTTGAPKVPVDQEARLSLLKKLEDQKLHEGAELHLKIETSKKPKDVRWYKNGQLITESPKLKLLGTGLTVFEMIIESAAVDDEGTYKVVVNDDRTTMDSSANVTVTPKAVQQPIRIVKRMENQICDGGSKAYFEVEVSERPISYKWYKNGAELEQSSKVKFRVISDKRYGLELEDTSKLEEGDYAFEVENTAGKDRCQGNLSVKSVEEVKKLSPPPTAKLLTIVRPLEDQTVTEGSAVTFEAEFSMKPKEVAWYKGMDKLIESDNVKVTCLSNVILKLEISMAILEDATSYRVEVVDDFGNVTTTVSKLTVIPSPDRLQFVKTLEDVEVLQGDSATFSVQVKGKPKVIRWYKNGRLIENTNKTLQKEGKDGMYSLTINDTTKDDHATYKCELSNNLGTISSEASLRIQPSAREKMVASWLKEAELKLLKGLSDVTVNERDEPIFEVTVQGHPTDVKWSINGVAVPEKLCKISEGSKGETLCRCHIPDVHLKNQGEVKVDVSNLSSSVKSSGQLKVTGKAPKILRGLIDRKSAPKNRVIFEVEVDRKPTSVKWYQNGRLMKEDARKAIISVDDCTYQLVLNDVEDKDAGSYSVVVGNNFGTDKSATNLIIVEPDKAAAPLTKPKIVEGLKDIEIPEGSDATFAVIVEGKPYSVKWYRNGIELSSGPGIMPRQIDDSTYKLTLRDCRKEDAGLIKVVAINSMGSDQSEGKLLVKDAISWGPSAEVDSAARFVIPLDDTSAPKSGSALLSCRVKGVPTPSIWWLKDGKEIDKSDRINIGVDSDGICSLKINGVTSEDVGHYACLAENSAGKDRTECDLTLGAPEDIGDIGQAPQFIKPLRSTAVVEGEDLTLDARIIGKPLPDICWFVSDKEVEPSDRIQGKIECISGEVIFRLVVRNMRPEDATRYKCVASNVHGTVESYADVRVEVPKPADLVAPKFVIPLMDNRLIESKTLLAEVKVRGRPVPTLTWYRNKVDISQMDRLTVEEMGDNRWKLTITDVRPEDSGFYECIATNSIGSDLSSAYFTVTPSKERRHKGPNFYPPVFNVPLHDRRLPEKSTMTIECFVDANPKAKIQWFKGDVELEEDAHIQIEIYPDGKCRLRINYFSMGDVGYYRCVATNELGSATTSAYLSIEVEKEDHKEGHREFAPYFTKVVQDVHAALGQCILLECNVAGLPFPEIRWYKDGMILTNRQACMELFEDGKCCLRIDNITAKNLGAYRCVASNVHGSSSCACSVYTEKVKEEKKEALQPPSILKSLADQWIDKGETLTLKCQVDGSQPLEFKWYKDGVLLRPSERLTFDVIDDGTAMLTCRSSVLSDDGMYRLFVENSEGSAHSLCFVSVLAKKEQLNLYLPSGTAPQVIIPLSNERRSEGDQLVLECQFSGNPHQIRWYKDGLSVSSDGHMRIENLDKGVCRLTIHTLMLKDEGSYRCMASNEFGSATTKCFARVEYVSKEMKRERLSHIKFTAPLRDMRILQSQDLILECICSSSETPTITWLKDGDELKDSNRVKIENSSDGRCRLRILQASPSDEGLYRCVVEDSTGTANTKSRVTIKSSFKDVVPGGLEAKAGKPPIFIEPLQSVRVAHGQRVHLMCRMQGDPMPEIRWHKDGDRIYSGGKYDISCSKDGLIELVINNASTWDSGSYRCVAVNEYGSARTLADVRVAREEKKAAADLEDQIRKGKAPGFIHPLTIKRITEGDSVVLECLPYGNPFPDIRWLKDGVEVSFGDRIHIQHLEDGWQRLVITDSILYDEGYYRCVASNEFGTSSTKAELIIEENLKRPKAKEPRLEPEVPQKPRFRHGLNNMTIHKGNPVEFECLPVGTPYPNVQWFKNGVPLTPSDRIIAWKDKWGYERLIILNCTPDDEGEYKCEITNSEGFAATDGTLTVLVDGMLEKEFKDTTEVERRHREHPERPETALFLRHLKNKHVFSGFPVIFDCLVRGPQPMEVQWFLNGKLIELNDRISMHYAGGGSYALVMQHASVAEAGEYVVEFRSSCGVISSSAILDVTVPHMDSMSLDVRPESTYHPLSEIVSRRTKYVGIPTPPDRGPFISEVTGHFLTLSWIPTRRAPPRYSQVTYIVEMRELPYKEWYVIDYNVPQPCCKIRNMEHGKSYQFRVRAENLYGISDPSPPSPPSQLMAPPQRVLDKNNRPIPLIDPYAESAIRKVYGEQYACAPWFSPMETEKFYCASQGKITISLFPHGFPIPEIQWLYRGTELSSSMPFGKYEMRSSYGAECLLTIYAFCKNDVGQYQCRAINENGEATQNIMLDLAVRPNFIQPLQSKVFKSDRSCRIDCQIDGTPEPEVKWFKDWKSLYESNRIKFLFEPPCTYSLVLETPLTRDTGVYTCVAANEAGEISSSATITVEMQPY